MATGRTNNQRGEWIPQLLRNHLCALESLKRVYELVDSNENNYDYSSWIFVLAQFTAPFNWSGNPAVSLPCGFTKSGLPIGLQLAGKKRSELSLFQASKAFEEIKPWHQNRPNI